MRATLSTVLGGSHLAEELFLPMSVTHAHGRTHVPALEPQAPILLMLPGAGGCHSWNYYFMSGTLLEWRQRDFKNKQFIVKCRIYCLPLRYFASSWGWKTKNKQQQARNLGGVFLLALLLKHLACLPWGQGRFQASLGKGDVL